MFMAGADESPPQLADPQVSSAVLIGVAEYDHLPRLPSVENNLASLKRLLTDQFLWGLPAERCRVVANPAVPSEIETALRDAAGAAGADGTLLVYYAGHGVVGPRGALHLAARATEDGLINSTSFPYDWLRGQVRTSAARQRIVILDCCYAGRALEAMSSPQLAGEVEIDRAGVLVAAPRTSLAFAPEGETHTAFSGELIKLLSGGLPGGPDPLDIHTVWAAVRRMLLARSMPLPELRVHNEGMALVRNAAYRRRESLAGQLLLSRDFSMGGDGTAVLLVLVHDAETGALAVRLDARTQRPVGPSLAEWADMAVDPQVLFDGGPLDPYLAFGVAVVPSGQAAPPGYTALSGRVGLLDLGADPTPARHSGVHLRIFVGYYGWAPGELEAEVAGGRLTRLGPATERVFEDR
jgi:putative AlgH/UPF0301 family transcriptional regulator